MVRSNWKVHLHGWIKVGNRWEVKVVELNWIRGILAMSAVWQPLETKTGYGQQAHISLGRA
jgi:hypothetical protein